MSATSVTSTPRGHPSGLSVDWCQARRGRARGAVLARAAGGGDHTLRVALIGCGEQGRVLLSAALKIPDLRFVAVCDIWPYHRTYGERLLKKLGHDARPFEDYREMLATEPYLDAVLVATPDFMHAEHTNACLRAGKHVYPRKTDGQHRRDARSMVRTSRERQTPPDRPPTPQ